MHLTELSIQNLRIITEMELSPSPGLNLITGNNGAGKTTVLEAIYLLGQGQSFRHSDAGPLIRKYERCARIVTDLVSDSGQSAKLGIERCTQGFKARYNGKDVNRRSELFRILPLQIITPHSHELIEKGPELRRQFMDHGLFHVEPGYHRLLSSFLRALKQRNAALRQKERKLALSFNDQLVDTGTRITDLRKNLVNAIRTEVGDFLGRMDVGASVELTFNPGWNAKLSLSEQLKKQEGTDLEQGYTTMGPQRGELRFTVDGVRAAKRLSRGQQKLLVYALAIAQIYLMVERGTERPILLVDDIGAELDSENLAKMIEYFHELKCQVWVSALDAGPISGCVAAQVFHVEQGRLVM